MARSEWQRWNVMNRWLRSSEFSEPEPEWVEALFLTTVEMLRDLHVRTIARSWSSLTNVERRAVYADVVRRIFRNRRPLCIMYSPDEANAHRTRAIEGVIDELMVRDEELPFEPICG
jgi:hypothetical protein